MSKKLILINYTSVGEMGYGGMFALAGGFKATITARLNGANLDVRGFPLGDGKLYEWGINLRRLETEEIPQGQYTYKKDPAFVKATGGYGTIPALLSEDGTIGCCESNAIARIVARSGSRAELYGKNLWETAQIEMFMDKFLVFERDRGPWIDATLFGPSYGFELSEVDLTKHRDESKKWFAAIDHHLEQRDFLVGDSISVADVVLVCQMLVPWCCLVDEAIKSQYQRLDKHLKKLWAMPEFEVDIGDAVRALTKEFAQRAGKTEKD